MEMSREAKKRHYYTGEHKVSILARCLVGREDVSSDVNLEAPLARRKAVHEHALIAT
jgi:hypothetical protein